jgi:hypothetical protein
MRRLKRPDWADYEYTDEEGTVLFAVERRPGKKFSQKRPNGDRWVYNLAGVRKVPYHLPEVLAAAQAGKEIWIAEGEKDVDELRRHGVVATCNPGGAGKWKDAYSDYLVGASRIVLIPDGDLPGTKHAESIARTLVNRGIRVQCVQSREGKDAS